MRILAINIGNSRAAAGWYADGEIVRARRGAELSAAMLGGGGGAPDGIGVASVVPARNAAVRKLLKKRWPGVPVRWVGPGLEAMWPLLQSFHRPCTALTDSNVCDVFSAYCALGTLPGSGH